MSQIRQMSDKTMNINIAVKAEISSKTTTQ